MPLAATTSHDRPPGARRARLVQGDPPRHRGGGRDRPRAGARAGWRRPTCARSPTAARARMEVLLTGAGRRDRRRDASADPLGREVDAGYALLEDGGTAVVEMAQASGLALVSPSERDAVAASTRRDRRADRRGRRRRRAGRARRLRRQRHHRRRRGRASRRSRRPAACAARGSSRCATCARRSSARPRSSARRRAPTRRPSSG